MKTKKIFAGYSFSNGMISFDFGLSVRQNKIFEYVNLGVFFTIIWQFNKSLNIFGLLRHQEGIDKIKNKIPSYRVKPQIINCLVHILYPKQT